MIYLVKESDCWIKKSATQGSAQVCNQEDFITSLTVKLW